MKTHKMLLPIGVLLFLLCMGKWALSAQQPLNAVPKSTTSNAITVIRDGINTELAKQQTMNTELYAADLLKADKTSFASQAAFLAAWGWNPGGGVSAWSDIQALLTPGGTYVKADGTTGDPPGTLPTGTEGQTIQYGSGGIPTAVDLATLAFTDNVSRNNSTGVVSVPMTATATSGSNVPLTSGGAYTALAGKQDADADLTVASQASSANAGTCFGRDPDGTVRFYTPAGSSGSFAFDTFPTYSDSAHTSGIAVNNTHVAFYSGATNGWGITPLTFSLSAAPATYELDLTLSGITGSDHVTINGTDYTASATISGLSSAETGITTYPDSGRVAVCSGDSTGSAPNYLVDMSSADKVVSCAFSSAPAAAFYGAPGSTESFGSGTFDLAEFSEVDPNSHITLSTDYHHTGTHGASFAGGEAAFGTAYIRGNLGQLEDSYTVEWWIKSPAASGDYTTRTFYAGSSGTNPTSTSIQTISLAWRGNGLGAQHLYMYPYTGGSGSVNTTVLTASTEYRFSLAVTRNSASVLSIYNTSGDFVTSLTVTAPGRQTQYFYWSDYPAYSIDDIKFDSTNP